jgi:tRNA uridine 5-carbamoylmethylation protein Kti12
MPELTEDDKTGVSPEVLKIWQSFRTKQDDPEAEAARDFSSTLDWLYKRRSNNLRDIITAESHFDINAAAAEKANAENEKLEKDGTLEEKRVKAMDVQREAVKALVEQYVATINAIALQIEKLQALQEEYIEKIEEYQQQAVAKIEERIKEPEQTRTARQP